MCVDTYGILTGDKIVVVSKATRVYKMLSSNASEIFSVKPTIVAATYAFEMDVSQSFTWHKNHLADVSDMQSHYIWQLDIYLDRIDCHFGNIKLLEK